MIDHYIVSLPRLSSAPVAGTTAGVPAVVVLVPSDCPACERVPEVVAKVRHLSPGIEVTVVDIAAAYIPDGIPFLGTPTYLIEDRIVSLGNPDPQDLVTIVEGWRTREG